MANKQRGIDRLQELCCKAATPWLIWFEVSAWRFAGCDERGAAKIARKWLGRS